MCRRSGCNTLSHFGLANVDTLKRMIYPLIVNSICVQVGQYVHALKMGWMKPTPKEEDKEEEDTPNYYMLWKEDEEVNL